MGLVARLFLDLGGIKQSGDDRCRPDADGNAGLHQLGTALFAGAVEIIVAVAHVQFSILFDANWEAA